MKLQGYKNRAYPAWEWTIEWRDEYGDIVDSGFSDTIPDRWIEDIQKNEAHLALLLRVGNKHDGDYDRWYAYWDNQAGKLDYPDNWPEDARLPKKVEQQLEKFKGKINE